MWRNMVEQVGGRAVLGTPFVGLLAAQILAETATSASGFAGLMFNDGLVDGKRYSLRLQGAFGTDGFVWENGSLLVTAPASTSYLLYEDNLLVPGGPISATVGTVVDSTRPTLTGPIVVGTVTSSSIQITWPAGYDLNGVSSYETSLDGTTWTNRGSVLTHTFTGLAPSFSYTLRVQAKDAAGNVSTPALSVTQSTSAGAAVPANTAIPTITGSAVVGQTLTASTGTWVNSTTSFTYRWLRGGATISGATTATYALQVFDIGAQISVGVIATNGAGLSAEAVSLQTAAVTSAADIAPPDLTGTISITSLTPTSYTATCPTATDVGGVTGYQYRINTGAWTTIAAAGQSIDISGRTAGSTDVLEMRAFDAAPNYSAALTYSVVLPAVVDVDAPSLTGAITSTAITSTRYTITCPVATDNVGVVSYQYRVNLGSWVTISNGSRSVTVTGRTPSTVDALDMRAVDGAGNPSGTLSYSITLLEASNGYPVETYASGLVLVRIGAETGRATQYGRYSKQPDEVLDFDFDFSRWFAQRGDSIQTFEFFVDPPDLTILGVASTDKIAKVVLGGGQPATRYKVTGRVMTVLGRVKEADITLDVKEL